MNKKVVVFAAIIIPLALLVVTNPTFSMFYLNNTSEIRFDDTSEKTVTVTVGQTESFPINVVSFSDKQFTDLNVKSAIKNYNESFLKVEISNIPTTSLLAKKASTGEFNVNVKALQLAQGDETEYSGIIQLYNGDKLMSEKPIKIIVRS